MHLNTETVIAIIGIIGTILYTSSRLSVQLATSLTELKMKNIEQDKRHAIHEMNDADLLARVRELEVELNEIKTYLKA